MKKFIKGGGTFWSVFVRSFLCGLDGEVIEVRVEMDDGSWLPRGFIMWGGI